MCEKKVISSISFVVAAAFRRLFSDTALVVEYSFEDGVYCHRADAKPISMQQVKKLDTYVRKHLESDSPIRLFEMPASELAANFQQYGYQDKVENIRLWGKTEIPVAEFMNLVDYRIEAMETDADKLRTFQLLQYEDGLLIRFPRQGKIRPFRNQKNVFATFQESQRWEEIIGVRTVNELNQKLQGKAKSEIFWMAEALHEKKLSQIADSLCAAFPQKRIVSISGPSASGKTTFAKRLRIQLKVNGYSARIISMDDYFVDRAIIPIESDGSQDFEAISAVNLTQLKSDMDALFSGENVPVRHYNFEKGVNETLSDHFRLGEREFIIFEGIHGLNPELTSIFNTGNVQKIFVSPITVLNIDSNHRVHTSDIRLLRRIIRDFSYRGYSLCQTLERWESVRRGEERYIFPFNSEADYVFNTALIYELPVMASFFDKILARSEDCQHSELPRLRTMLKFFHPVQNAPVHDFSILREFIGGSHFGY